MNYNLLPEYYAAVNATLQDAGFRKLAESEIDRLSTELAYHASFIATCEQAGISKDAAAQMYKEAQGGALKAGIGFLGKTVGKVKNVGKAMSAARKSGLGLRKGLAHPNDILKGEELFKNINSVTDDILKKTPGLTEALAREQALTNVGADFLRGAANLNSRAGLRSANRVLRQATGRVRNTPLKEEILARHGITPSAPPSAPAATMPQATIEKPVIPGPTTTAAPTGSSVQPVTAPATGTTPTAANAAPTTAGTDATAKQIESLQQRLGKIPQWAKYTGAAVAGAGAMKMMSPATGAPVEVNMGGAAPGAAPQYYIPSAQSNGYGRYTYG